MKDIPTTLDGWSALVSDWIGLEHGRPVEEFAGAEYQRYALYVGLLLLKMTPEQVNDYFHGRNMYEIFYRKHSPTYHDTLDGDWVRRWDFGTEDGQEWLRRETLGVRLPGVMVPILARVAVLGHLRAMGFTFLSHSIRDAMMSLRFALENPHPITIDTTVGAVDGDFYRMWTDHDHYIPDPPLPPMPRSFRNYGVSWVWNWKPAAGGHRRSLWPHPIFFLR